MEDDKIVFNGKEISKEQFEQEKRKLEEKKMKLVEISPNNYKTRLED